MGVMNEIAAKVATLTGLTVGTTIFLGYMPSTPDAICCIYEYGGQAPEFQFGVLGIKREIPAIQVSFRGAPGDYAAPRTLANTAWVGLARVEAASLTGGTTALYYTIHPVQSPFLIVRDESNRPIIGFNIYCEKELSA